MGEPVGAVLAQCGAVNEVATLTHRGGSVIGNGDCPLAGGARADNTGFFLTLQIRVCFLLEPRGFFYEAGEPWTFVRVLVTGLLERSDHVLGKNNPVRIYWQWGLGRTRVPYAGEAKFGLLVGDGFDIGKVACEKLNIAIQLAHTVRANDLAGR